MHTFNFRVGILSKLPSRSVSRPNHNSRFFNKYSILNLYVTFSVPNVLQM